MTDRKPCRHRVLARTDSLLGENSARLEQTGTRMGPARMRTLRRSSKPARFPLSSIQNALRLYHRFPRSERNIEEVLHQRGILVSIVVNGHPSWAGRTRFSTPARMRTPLLHETLREWCIKFGPLFVEVLRHRDTETVKTLLIGLLGEYEVPEVIHTDQLRSYGAAIREIPSLVNVNHQQVISTARCNNLIEQRASVASRAVLPKTIPPS